MTAATIKETTTLPDRLPLLYEACIGVGLGSLVFTALLWKNIATAFGKVENFFKSREALFRAGAVILELLSHLETSPKLYMHL